MVKREGQATVEFLLMLSLLTAIGIFIMMTMTSQGNNAIGSAQNSAVNAIVNN